MLAEFAINNKIHSTTKVSPFMVKYRRELRMGVDIRRKRKMEKVMEFVKRIKKVARGSRSSTEENARGDETTSR